MGLELECGKDFDVLARGQRILAMRLGDHSGIRDRTKRHNLWRRDLSDDGRLPRQNSYSQRGRH